MYIDTCALQVDYIDYIDYIELKTQPTLSAIRRKTACINPYVKLNA